MPREVHRAGGARHLDVLRAAAAVPDFIIIGAAKSASTWLQLALRQHPGIYIPAQETPFFEDPHYNEHDLSALQSDIAFAPQDAVVGIKCPNYLCTPQCASRLAKHVPQARLIAILRNPVDRAISQYYHLIRSDLVPHAPADVAFSRYLAGEFDPRYAELLVMRFGLYAEGIANYRREFPSDRLLILTDLDMRKGSRDVFRRVCRFLGVDDTFVPMSISVRRNQGVYSSPFLSFIQSMYHRGQTYDSATGRVTLRPGPVGWSARRLALLGGRLSAATRMLLHKQQPAVSVKTRAALLDFYIPDIVRLEAMTKLDLSPWKELRQPTNVP